MARTRLLGAALAAGLCLATGAAAHPGDGTEKAAEKTRTFELTYQVTIRDVDGKRIDVWLPSAESDDAQEIEVLSIETPWRHVKHREAKYGNEIIHFGADDPAPGPHTATMKLRVKRKERRVPLGGEPAAITPGVKAKLARFLGPNSLVPVDGEVAKIAAGLAPGEKDPWKVARAIYDYVTENMTYDKTGTGWGTGSTEWACTAKYGNCTDFHALFISLARARGIPAKFSIGFPLPPERGEGTIGGYHCWADFFIPGHGWVPVDISEADKHPELLEYYFGAHSEDRVEFTRGRDIVLEPAQKGPPLNYFIYPYVEVDGKVHEAVERVLTYRDIPEGGEGK